MGEPKKDFDQHSFTSRITDLVADNRDAILSRLNAGMITLEIAKISADCWFRLPSEFTMIAKALMNLDRVVYALDPTFDPNAIIREQSSEILNQNLLRSVSPSSLLSGAVDVKEFAEKLPMRVNRILDAIGNNELRLKVDSIDERIVLDGLQKIANRITLGLVVAALIVGAAMLMRVDTTFRIFGYPGLAMIFFLMAAAAGLVLAYNILFRDQKTPVDVRYVLACRTTHVTCTGRSHEFFPRQAKDPLAKFNFSFSPGFSLGIRARMN
jgi:hypothetical protein